MPGGRPTKYKEEFCEIMIDMAAQGCGVVEICSRIDISKQTFYRWKSEKVEFSDAFTIAKLKCQAWWEAQGRRLEGGELNHGLWKLNMVNRFPDDWSDKKEVEHQVSSVRDIIKQARENVE